MLYVWHLAFGSWYTHLEINSQIYVKWNDLINIEMWVPFQNNKLHTILYAVWLPNWATLSLDYIYVSLNRFQWWFNCHLNFLPPRCAVCLRPPKCRKAIPQPWVMLGQKWRPHRQCFVSGTCFQWRNRRSSCDDGWWWRIWCWRPKQWTALGRWLLCTFYGPTDTNGWWSSAGRTPGRWRIEQDLQYDMFQLVYVRKLQSISILYIYSV